MAELIIEHTFETTDKNGHMWKREVNDTITLDLLSTGYTLEKPDDENIRLIPKDDSIFEPFWDYLDKDKYRIELKKHLYKRKSTHPATVSVDVYEKETGRSFYLTAYSPDLTEMEYNYFYELLKAGYPEIQWLNIQEYIKGNVRGYLSNSNADDFFDSETAELIGEYLINTRQKEVLKPGSAEFDCENIQALAKEAIKDGILLLLAASSNH